MKTCTCCMLGLEAWLDIEAKFDWPRHQHLASVSVICHRVERGGRDNVEEFFLDSVLVLLPRRFGTDFRPYVSSVGQNWILFFSNISAKVQARHVKLATLIDSRTVYRHMSTDARYYFRFRHRAPRKSFLFRL